MKVVFFNRFFYPNLSATSQLLADLAFSLSGRDFEVHVVTSAEEGTLRDEIVSGVVIHRVCSVAASSALRQKALAYARYYRASQKAARDLLSVGDIAVIKTDPPLLSCALASRVVRAGAKFIVWQQDVFPEIAQAYGVIGVKGIVAWVLKKIRNRSLASAQHVVTISDDMARRLSLEVPNLNQRLRVIHNWSNGDEIKPIPNEANELRRQWGLSEKFVVAYSGNFGRVHEFETVIGATESLKEHEGSLAFLFIGGGPRLREVQCSIRKRGISNVIWQPAQPRGRLSEALGVGDVHLCILDPRFEGLVQPSKLYGIMAAGRPTIFVGDPSGESARILRDSNSGRSVSTGDADGLARTIIELKNDRELRVELGRNARETFLRRFNMPIALAAWHGLLCQP